MKKYKNHLVSILISTAVFVLLSFDNEFAEVIAVVVAVMLGWWERGNFEIRKTN